MNKIRHRWLIYFLSLWLLILIVIINNVSSDSDPDSVVDSIFIIEFETATDLKINIEIDVSEITVFETTYYSDDIQDLVEDDPETLGAIKLRLHDLLKNQIEDSFDKAEVVSINKKPIYENNKFYDDFSINLTYAFFGLNDAINTRDLINGALDMGAVITYDFNLQAEFGWNNTYTYILSDSMRLVFANTTDVDLNKNEISWTLENWNGGNTNTLAKLSTRFKTPTTPSLEKENISLQYDLDTKNIDDIFLKTTILIKNIDIRKYDILPDFISELDFVPSDGVRLFIDNELLTWNDLYQTTIRPVEQHTISIIENSSFNQTLYMPFNWDLETTINCSKPFNTTSMDDVPPLKAELKDEDVELRICDMSSRAFFGLVNAGAEANISADDINFGDKLDEIGLPYEVFLHLPNNILLEGENVYRWNRSGSISGEFELDLLSKPDYSKEKIDTEIEFEITKMDLNIPSLFSAKNELTATVHIKQNDDIYVMSLPEGLKLSEKIDLAYINSDAFRLCSEESVFTQEDIDIYLDSRKDFFEKRLSNVLYNLDIKGVVNREVFSDSLNWDGDVSNMDDVVPVIFSLYANDLYPIAFNLSLWPFEIILSNQTFYLNGLENRSVTYNIVFPKGIDVEVKDTLNKPIIKGEKDDGRTYLELSFSSDEGAETGVILCEIRASTLYVLGLFLPCILSLILVVVLLLVIVLIRRKRRGGKIMQDETETSGYENQEYYMPPPPPRR